MAFIHDNRELITSAADGVVRIWDVEQGRQTAELLGASAGGTNIRVDQQERRLTVFTESDTYLVFSLAVDEPSEGAAMTPCDGPLDTLNLRGGTRTTSADTFVYALCNSMEGGFVHIWDRASAEVARHGPFDGQSIAASADGSLFLAAPLLANDPTIPTAVVGPYGVYESESGAALHTLRGICEADHAADSVEDRLPEGCSQFPPQSFETLDEVLPIEFSAFDLDISPDSRLVAGATWTSTAMVWDLASGEPLFLTSGDSVAFSPDGARLAVFSATENDLRLLDTAEFQTVASTNFDDSEPSGQYLVFTGDGSYILGAPGLEGSADVVLYDAQSLAEVRRLSSPHEGETRDIAASTDGASFATAGSDGYVRVWDTETLQLIHDIPISDVRVQSVNFTDGDTRLVVASFDGMVREVLLDPTDLLAYARSRVVRGFTEEECNLYFPNAACPDLTQR